MARNGWDVLYKISSILLLAVFCAFVLLAVFGWIIVRAVLKRVDAIVSTVKTATTKAVEVVAAALKSGAGVFQNVEHEIGDLIAVVKNGVQTGLYEVREGYKLVKKDVNAGIHHVLEGDFGLHQVYVDAKNDVHRVISDSYNHLRRLVATAVDGGSEVELEMRLLTMDSALVRAVSGLATDASTAVRLAPFEIAGQVVTLLAQELDSTGSYVLTLVNKQAVVAWSDVF